MKKACSECFEIPIYANLKMYCDGIADTISPVT